ncbi:vanadium-dependent haloperoxidase [Dictyobacter formicarum]|uniref:Phosphatidic acid phosphatase type 2/haloperoxidase domain-containing protein n=1 Tax=Dictyobacter formicarum TaxID=2778368 RepID=A0ABQ3VLD4_9CHLR|nr:vanadium-dependent haloperoxidase [Dictyobacter formicarum]GHO86610.1 hypothetical protein KSZ_46160 [Dictyobacter formicarum]
MGKIVVDRNNILRASMTLLKGVNTLPAVNSMYSAQVALLWNEALLQAIRTSKPTVTIVARALAIVHTCMYDAWSAYNLQASSTCCSTRLRRPEHEHTQANKEEAISYAAYWALQDLFPEQELQFRTLMCRLGYSTLNQASNTSTPAGIGNLMARMVLDFRHHDGSNQLGDMQPGAYADYTSYQPVNTPDQISDPNSWQPLRVPGTDQSITVQKCVTPHWGRVRPFSLAHGSQFRPAVPPATIYNQRYSMQANQLLDISANLTDKQKTIVEYWQDGPSNEQLPGHWFVIARYVVRRDLYNLDSTIKLFFILGNALLDASIVCWDTKRAYNSERPITAIHYLYAGRSVLAWGGPHQGSGLINGSDWRPYQMDNSITPSTPEYCSEHSAFSVASASILNFFTRSDYFGGAYTRQAGSSAIEPGTTPKTDITLRWKTFSEAASEAGSSRLYAGTHFEQGDITGRVLGREIGKLVWQRAQRYINGSI